MIKHKQVLVNLVDLKLTKFEKIDSPINALEDKVIRRLIIELKTEGQNKILIAIKSS